MTEREELADEFDGIAKAHKAMGEADEARKYHLAAAALRTPAVTDEMVERVNLRKLVDIVWLHATENGSWPSTKTADVLIGQYLAAFAAKSSPAPLTALNPRGESDPSVMPDYGAGETIDYERKARAVGWIWELNFGSAPNCPRHPERGAWASDWRDAWEQEQLFQLPNKTPAQETALKVWSAWDLMTRNQNQIHGMWGFSQAERMMIVLALLGGLRRWSRKI